MTAAWPTTEQRPSVTVRIGFIGTGFIARTHNWFLKHTAAEHQIVAVHDLEADRAQAFAARVGAEEDMEGALGENAEVYEFLRQTSAKFGLGFWKPGAGIIHSAQFLLEY